MKNTVKAVVTNNDWSVDKKLYTFDSYIAALSFMENLGSTLNTMLNNGEIKRYHCEILR